SATEAFGEAMEQVQGNIAVTAAHSDQRRKTAEEIGRGHAWRAGAMCSAIGPKPARLPLDPVSYVSLRQRNQRRGGWLCQSCGTMSNLEVHHKQFRRPRLRREPDHALHRMHAGIDD